MLQGAHFVVHALYKVHTREMRDDARPQKIQLIFFRTGNGAEPVRDWLKELPEAERLAIGQDLLRAQWLARRDATMPCVGRWTLGNPDGLGNQAYGARNDVPLSRSSGGAAWLHQKDANHAGG